MTTLAQQAVDAAIRLSYQTREAAHAKGITQEAVNLEVQLLQETADNGAKEEDRNRAKRTINQLLWNGGRKYTYKQADMKVAA